MLILFSLTNFGIENCFIIRFDPYCPPSKQCQLEHHMMSDKGYGVDGSHSIYHPLSAYLTLTFQRNTCHLLCFSTATNQVNSSYIFYSVSEVGNGNILPNEQRCLWGCGNAFIVNLNRNLKEKKTSLFRQMYIFIIQKSTNLF